MYEDEQGLPPLRQEWRKYVREDFFETMRDEEFRLRYRFTKPNVLTISERLEPYLKLREGSHVLTPLQMTMTTLSFLGGNDFQRTTSLLVRCSQGTVSNCVTQTLDALVQLKPRYIRFGSQQETQASADFIRDRFRLPMFPYAIDGCHVNFKEKPRDVPGELNPVDFFNRKGRYSMNVMVIANSSYRILHVDCRWPGSAHDARIWNESEAKPYLMDLTRKWYLAGDAAYPLSPKLMKPFPRGVVPLSLRQKVFNYRLSGLRTFMSENVFGQWKRRFPVLDNMRMHHPNAMKAVIATAVLHNMAIAFREEPFPEENPTPEEDIPGMDDVVIEDFRGRREIFEAGIQERL